MCCSGYLGGGTEEEGKDITVFPKELEISTTTKRIKGECQCPMSSGTETTSVRNKLIQTDVVEDQSSTQRKACARRMTDGSFFLW